MSRGNDSLERGDRLLKDTGTAVKDALTGVVLQNPHLALLNIGNTVVRRDYCEVDDIKIVSGGESGHDPLYAGFVGKGLLTAAIQGDIFTCPPSYHIKNVLKELCYNKLDVGILVIVQNNPGDTLNFGLAVEQAQSEGVKVRLIVVTDDCSDVMPTNVSDQPRGLTGVILIQKIASALAEEGLRTLAQMHAYCNDLQKNLSTVLLTLQECMGENERTCICTKHGFVNEADIGGGLHGESGKRITLSTVDGVVSDLLKEISKNVILDTATPIVLMVNNLRVSKFEESIFVGELLNQLFAREVKIVRIYVGTFMSSLETKGFTITILKADGDIIKYLDYSTNAPAWNSNVFPLDPTIPTSLNPRIRLLRYPRLELKGPKLRPRQSNVLILVVRFACDALISCEKQLNVIDAEYGDGDTGSRIRVAAEEILEGLNDEGLNVEYLYVFFKQLSRVSEKINGTLAALYSIVFEAAANHMSTLESETAIDSYLWLSCLFDVINSLRSHTKTEEGNSNMITPLVHCACKTEEVMNTQTVSGIEAFCYGVDAAEESVQSTRLPGKKFPDPGAHAVHIWMRAVLEGVKFRCEY